MVEIENMDEVFAGLFFVPAISEATPTTSTQPSLDPLPESLTIPQYPPDVINIVQQTEEGNNGYACQQPLIDSFELPNHLQDQFLSPPVPENYPSYPAYQHGPIGSHFNMYEQQPPPRNLTNREDEHLPPRMVTDLVMNDSQQNQISMIPPQPRMLSSSTRTCPLQNQNSMMPPPSQVSSSSTWTPQQNQIPMRRLQSQMPRSTTTRTHLLQNQISVTSPQLQIPSISTRQVLFWGIEEEMIKINLCMENHHCLPKERGSSCQ
ncbi:PREDICTED: uncharacterized protein LOC104759482 [Camelina sativa]|uniref:Uncharacterized protein LOC104759482 n=1 Tax=Camelina sativa TaxID=90675 RepID=A0ABM1R622_CAMSA|nr:PREDICTED: uncharacterized protein LOC104759482 [Camelina sativa]